MTKEKIIEALGLIKHPEGGFYKETFRSEVLLTNASLPQHNGDRSASTAIYFLITNENFSAFHKVIQDESWFFHFGDPITLYMISPSGELTEVIIGSDIMNGEQLQFTVPGNHWFAAKSTGSNGFSLVSCTVAPGFEFNDFTLAVQSELEHEFPEHSAIIRELTRT